MIVRKRPNLLQLFLILHGSVLTRIYPQVLIVMLLSAFVVFAHGWWPGLFPTFSGAPFALLGIALSVFLGFSNNACYDRWWEGRKAWGKASAGCRNLARHGMLLEERGAEGIAGRKRLACLAISFCHALVVHLRDEAPRADLERTVPEDIKSAVMASENKPDVLLRAMGQELARLHRVGVISDIEYQTLDTSPALMTEAQIICERIKTTPVPFGYTLLLHRTAYLFCFLLPFGFADVLGWTTPIAAAIVAYTFFGLDALGSELEEPFGTLPNNLPIAALAAGIEANLREALGEAPLPIAPLPVEHILQ